MTSGLTFTASAAPVPPFIPFATLDPATANADLTLVNQTVTINTSTSSWAAVCSTDGAWPLPTSTANSLSFTLELVMNTTADNDGKFFMGTVLTDNYSNNTFQPGLFGPGGIYNYLFGTTTAYMYADGAGYAFAQPGGNFLPIQAGDVLGLAVGISANAIGVMEAVLYLNGNEALPGYTFTVGVGTTGSITPFVAYSLANGSPSVTLRTNPATFRYANSYTNQNGWPPYIPGGNLKMTFNTAFATTATNTVYLPIGGSSGTANAVINWGDGKLEYASTANVYSHTYATTGTYHVTISGAMSAYGQDFRSTGENHPLVSVDSWDNNLGLSDLTYAFTGATNLTQVPNNLPSTVQFLSVVFDGATVFNQDLSGWDTSNVRAMGTFSGATSFNGNISGWNTANVIYMEGTFFNASAFNQDLSGWDISNVQYIDGMFYGANSFNSNIGGWNTAKVFTMNNMFGFASSFNQDLGLWDTSGVRDMGGMFRNASAFNQDIGSWNTANVTLMSNMFLNASTFNQNLSGWNVANVSNAANHVNFSTGATAWQSNYQPTFPS